jgi:hypothetical protein
MRDQIDGRTSLLSVVAISVSVCDMRRVCRRCGTL